MNEYVADTHALFWYLVDSPRLGEDASATFDEADRGEAVIFISAITLAELYYLNEKLGRPIDFSSEFEELSSSSQFSFVAFAAEDVSEFSSLNAVHEMHDRIIAGVAKRMGLPLLTADLEITESGLVSTIW
jgi:PIN domain nuclease of toxin-antitoxin system